ncbi:MAG: roadblock/LC7 domain-containing protein [Anaerolineales bacterium]|nr:roadblock/LC7 domain-containing protein [Anaerolineales bacterium]MCA9927491.1 roadblock/LC7 domain-containing protein [Anaerolineales bacterium]
MAKLDDILQTVRAELGAEFISANVVGMDGLPIATLSADSNYDDSVAAARFAMVMKLASKVSGKIEMGDVEDTLTTTENSLLLTRFLGDGSYYWGMFVTEDATLGMVRMIMNEYADYLWDAVPR